jgi:chitin deacetylase
VQQHPQLVRQILAAGHQVGNHSFSHQRMIFKSPAFVAGEIEQTDKLLRDSGVDGVIYFRPPYGKKLLVLPWYLMKHHRVSVTWDVAPENFPKIAKDPQALVDYTVQQTKPGSIILLHVMYDSRQATMQAVPQIIRQLKAQGYRFVTVHELLKLEQAP